MQQQQRINENNQQKSMLSNVGVDTSFKKLFELEEGDNPVSIDNIFLEKRETIWRKIRSKGWKISDKSIQNLERSIERFENKLSTNNNNS